jgi:hypothetical protein
MTNKKQLSSRFDTNNKTLNIMIKIITFFLILFLGLTTFGQWNQIGADIDGNNNFHRLGKAVSISSDGLTMAVASSGYQSRGLVRIFKIIGGTWTQQGADINGEATGDISGSAISLSSDGLTIAIGATSNDASANNAGHVRIFKYDGTSWNQLGADIDGEAISDGSGNAVSLSSDGLIVAIGARINNGGGVNRGHVRVYKYNGSSWIQEGFDIDGEADSDGFGWSVSLSSDGLTLAIGGYTNDGGGNNAGHVQIYEFNGTNWVQKGLDIEGEAPEDFCGSSVSLSSNGQTVAIGAQGNDESGSFSGHVRIYDFNGTNWNQKGLDIDGEAAGDRSGYSVDLSADGLTVAIGAYKNAGTGVDAGHVRVYKYNGSNWIQQGADIDGEAAGDDSGIAVAISDNGLTVVIGASGSSGIWNSSGQVRIYNYCEAGTSIDLQTACDSLVWIDGITYYTSTNTPVFSLTGASANGCDSIITLNLTINNSPSSIDTHNACDSLVWIDGNTYYTSTNIPTFNIVGGAVNGCDSVITLNLTINNSAIGSDVQTACGSYTWIDGNTYTSSTNAPTFNIVNGAVNGCDSLVTLNLTINNSTTGTDIQSACESYTWIDGVTYNTSTSTPTYNLVEGATNGCDSLVTLNLTIIPTPNNTITTSSTTITANEIGATYQWIDCSNGNTNIPGETNTNFTATTNGDYAVIVTMNSCSDTSSCETISSVSVSENNLSDQFRIYPNPVKDQLTIESDITDLKITLADITGKNQPIEINKINSKTSTLSFSELPSGIYFITLSSNNNTITKKVIKQ